MVVDRILNMVVPGRAARKAREAEDRKLDKELKETFPSSDPLASSQPGSGVTGPEVGPLHPSPSQIAKEKAAAKAKPEAKHVETKKSQVKNAEAEKVEAKKAQPKTAEAKKAGVKNIRAA